MRAVMFVMAFAVACGPGDRGDTPCTENARRCEGTLFETCDQGRWKAVDDCASACSPRLGCVTCLPDTGTCNGDTSIACLPDGSDLVTEYCDPVMGTTCDVTSGRCMGPCASRELGRSYIGCEYYATVTSQLVGSFFEFGITISNTTVERANVTIEGGALPSALALVVEPGTVAIQPLPWVAALKTCVNGGESQCGAPQHYGALVADGAYHVRSTQPITVYQFSPLEYKHGTTPGYSADASLLLPTNAWTKHYAVASWQAWFVGEFGTMPGLLAVTAARDGTMVTITTRANTVGGNGAPSFVAGVPQTVALDRGGVVQLLSNDGDLTGSLVTASEPVQVIGGHHCTQVPLGYIACDHLEQSMFPIETLANEYLVASPRLGDAPRIQMTRIIAVEPNTSVTLDPPIAGPYTLAMPGDFAEIAERSESFLVTANKKVMVAQYMVSESAGTWPGVSSDPSLVLAVPLAQYRSQYLFHAPTSYLSNFVNVTAELDTDILLDGVIVSRAAFAPIGSTKYGVARLPLANLDGGRHEIQSDRRFGISVYGYGDATSYWYPGGLDLNEVEVE